MPGGLNGKIDSHIEIYGQKGLSDNTRPRRSYGTETLTYGIRVPGMAPKEKMWQFGIKMFHGTESGKILKYISGKEN